MHFAHDPLAELGTIWVERNPFHRVQAVVKFVANLPCKKNQLRKTHAICENASKINMVLRAVSLPAPTRDPGNKVEHKRYTF